MGETFRKGVFDKETVYYFTMGDMRKTVRVNGERCQVEDGKTVEEADCVCKTSTEFFRKVWEDGYKPGVMDFMSGAIKSNAPHLLQQFMAAFGK